MGNKRVIVVDDDSLIRELVASLLRDRGYEVVIATNGSEALQMVQQVKPDLVVSDFSMPVLDGREMVRRLRMDVATRNIPVLMLTGSGDATDRVKSFRTGVDDYINKPFGDEEFLVRVESLLERSERALWTNPLTFLPGNPAIEEEATRRIQNGRKFGFAYADLDNFKAYNDLYGFKKGDEVIIYTSRAIVDTVRELGGPEDFVGHIGGDDFVVIAELPKMQAICEQVCRKFDARIGEFYSDQDRQRGFVEATDRQGRPMRFPLMTLSVGVVENETLPIQYFGQLVQVATEMKGFVKKSANRKGSVFAFNRRNV